jgi:sarcosine oxidase/L-pipecolate oxidase
MFPERLKFAGVKPLYKKKEKSGLSNYRPISLITSFSKVIEKIIYRRLYDHLNINNILVNEQFGFRDNLPTEIATYTILNKILTSLNNKILVGGLFWDL